MGLPGHVYGSLTSRRAYARWPGEMVNVLGVATGLPVPVGPVEDAVAGQDQAPAGAGGRTAGLHGADPYRHCHMISVAGRSALAVDCGQPRAPAGAGTGAALRRDGAGGRP